MLSDAYGLLPTSQGCKALPCWQGTQQPSHDCGFHSITCSWISQTTGHQCSKCIEQLMDLDTHVIYMGPAAKVF